MTKRKFAKCGYCPYRCSQWIVLVAHVAKEHPGILPDTDGERERARLTHVEPVQTWRTAHARYEDVKGFTIGGYPA